MLTSTKKNSLKFVQQKKKIIEQKIVEVEKEKTEIKNKYDKKIEVALIDAYINNPTSSIGEYFIRPDKKTQFFFKFYIIKSFLMIFLLQNPLNC